MAKKVINVGLLTNDGTGDTLRAGAQKINDNFTELYTFLSGSGGQLSLVSSVAAGEGISVSSPSGNVLIANKIATSTVLGGVKVGSNLSVSLDGTVDYVLPEAGLTTLGGVKIDGITITKDQNGVISAEAAPSTPDRLESGGYVASLELDGSLVLPTGVTNTARISNDDGISFKVDTNYWTFATDGTMTLPINGDILDSDGNSVLGQTTLEYTLPIASANVLGGIKVGTNISVDAEGRISVNLSSYTTQTYVANYIGSQGFATQSYVNSQGFVNSSMLGAYATQSYVQGYVNGQGFITGGALSGYATQSYVTSQGYITSAAIPSVFSSVAVSGQSTISADNSSDTLTLVAGSNITITTNAVSDTITISSTGSVGGTSNLDDLGDVVITGTPTNGQVLKYNGTNWVNGTDTTGGSGTAYDQSLNTTDAVTFDEVTASSFVSSAAGVPTLTSATNINLTATNAVVVTTSPFRLASLTTTQRDAFTAVNGDMIYNSTTNKLQGYQNGTWINLDGTA